eukprot:m.636771 g.636771  ORF g.636771 m.636771 type:complete len:57 (-) comp22599_c0_seq6:285-455(-)
MAVDGAPCPVAATAAVAFASETGRGHASHARSVLNPKKDTVASSHCKNIISMSILE